MRRLRTSKYGNSNIQSVGGRYFNFNCSFIDIMTPNKQPECVECTEHEMIREGSVHKIKAMNCRIKPSDPVFFDPNTPDTEWSEALQVEVMDDYLHLAEMRQFAKDPVAHMEEMREHWQKLQDFISTLLSSRDTYWKERVDFEAIKWGYMKLLGFGLQNTTAENALMMDRLRDFYQE